MIKDIAKKLQKVMATKKISSESCLALVLGSGWNQVVDSLEILASFPYTEFEGLPKVNVVGHHGILSLARWEDKNLLIFQGRFHPYEGHSAPVVTFTVRVAHELGIKKVILTNASGGINWTYPNGSIVAISDHINMMGINPLQGPHQPELGVRFPSMNDVYCADLRKVFKQCCEELSIPYFEGIYAGMLGPSYETPAEIRMLRIMGADLVGMSTIPEAILATSLGMKVLALSCVSNKAAHLNQGDLEHEQVKSQVESSMEVFQKVILHTIKKV